MPPGRHERAGVSTRFGLNEKWLLGVLGFVRLAEAVARK